MKNIKKMLAQHKSEILPDDKIKDNIKRQLGMQQTESALAYAHGGEKTVDNRRKNGLIVLCAAMLALAILLGVLIPKLLNPGSSPLVPSFETRSTHTARLRLALCLSRQTRKIKTRAQPPLRKIRLQTINRSLAISLPQSTAI